MDLYTSNALDISEVTTKNYSTSFSMGVWLLRPKYRPAIYGIYGFVRFADEIVDTFHDQDKRALLETFRKDTFEAIEKRMSPNPILHSFQWVVNRYKIDHALIEAFLKSMDMDLYMKTFNKAEYQEYIYGSAEVVGLMCLRVFYGGDDEGYERLVLPARKLGEAFQKVNFLRDLKADFDERGRVYFPNVAYESFSDKEKKEIEADLRADFAESLPGIRNLKRDVRLGVYLAYRYYHELLRKIEPASPQELTSRRFSVSTGKKLRLLAVCWFRHTFNWV
ncbi:MAG: phytoene/squalene synthase family protein [Bacteroides sp.]|jgi:phytoene/squalene synthetase|nr:phytoene/squalene synthase family protein [Bacteroides sp.]